MRDVLLLKAECDENVPQAVQRNGLQKLVGEIERKGGAIRLELADDGWAVQCGHQADQLLDLITSEHPPASLHLIYDMPEPLRLAALPANLR